MINNVFIGIQRHLNTRMKLLETNRVKRVVISIVWRSLKTIGRSNGVIIIIPDHDQLATVDK